MQKVRMIIGVENGAYVANNADDLEAPALFSGLTAEEAAWVMRRRGVQSWLYSSSADFADEYGFDQPDARTPLEEAYRKASA